MTEGRMALLEVEGVVSGYRAGTVLHGVDLELDEGGAIGILGRNGVGKTTLVMTLMGLVRPRAGSIRFDGLELAGKRTDAIARQGMSLVPQGRRVFGGLTVAEHLDLAASRPGAGGPWDRERVRELFLSLEGNHSLVVVEHDMKFIGALTQNGKNGKKVTVLHEGSVLAEGTLDEVQGNERVIEVYLGR